MAEEYKSVHPGPDIDAAVTRSLAGGPIDKALSEKLSLSGGTLTGNLAVERDTYPQINIKQSAEGSRAKFQNSGHTLMLEMSPDGTDSTRRSLIIRDQTVTAYVAYALQFLSAESGGNTTTYNILHTGNKPAGTYTGNGDATSRTIDTGGIGSCLMIYTSSNLVFVWPDGACVLRNTKEIVWLSASACKFSNGVLTLATTEVAVNGTYTYKYQVL